ncbi:MAG: DNA glycosylase [Lachnospiraceae bacterium]|nr:DNA-3-methyladenine glycosylase 2 family protein [Lachnospiraceae bacterium]MDD7051168.1 DNA glycosylase [Lachnospiraceae bacterium]MDY4097388.1 DNA glycosylase [Lachnospiraceae bacterium]
MTVQITDDFDLKKIADSGQCFRIKAFPDGTYRFITGNQVLYIRKIEPELYDISCSEEIWNSVWYPYFDLDRSYSEIRKRIGPRDQYMLAAAENGRGIRILRQDPWEMLITFIISQQKTIPAIKAAVETLAVCYGSLAADSTDKLYCFPTPWQLSVATEENLREYKLGYRAPYIMDAIRQVQGKQIDLYGLASRSDRKLFETLKQIAGVGDKVANCICLFAYGRTRLAPVDTWIKKVIDQKYKGKNPFPKYKDGAGIMQQYIFYYAQTHKEEFQV